MKVQFKRTEASNFFENTKALNILNTRPMSIPQLIELDNFFEEKPKAHRLAYGRFSKALLIIKLITKCMLTITQNWRAKNLTIVHGYALLTNRGVVSATDISPTKTLLKCAITLTPAIAYEGKFRESPLATACERLGFDYKGNIRTLLNGNNTLIIFAEVQDKPVVIHYGQSPQAKNAINRHQQGLEKAWKHFKKTPIANYLPSIVKRDGTKKNEFFIETYIYGETGARSKNEEIATIRTINLIDFAIDMQNYSTPKYNKKNHITSVIECIEKNLNSEQLKQLEDAILITKKWQEANESTAIAHGDLWLGNAIFDGNNTLQGVIDWEWQASDGPLIYDPIHCLITSYAYIKKLSLPLSLSAFWSMNDTDPWLISIMNYIEKKTGFNHADQRAVSVIIWLSIIKRSHVETGPMSVEWTHTHIRDLSTALRLNYPAFPDLRLKYQTEITLSNGGQ